MATNDRFRRFRRPLLAVCTAVLLGAAPAPSAPPAAATPEMRTEAAMSAAVARYAADPTALTLFLQGMPKGGDLHHHLSGSVYAESYLQYAADEHDCIDRTFTFLPPPCHPAKGIFPAARAIDDYQFRNEAIDALSARDFVPGPGDLSASVHFFLTFFKFDLVVNSHWPQEIAEVTHRAALQHVSYIETMLSPDKSRALALGTKVGWTKNYDRMREKLDAAGVPKLVIQAKHDLATDYAKARTILKCSSAAPDPGCGVTLRFIAFVLRDRPIEQVFAQIQTDFELAAVDPTVVSVNPVEAQSDYKSYKLYDETMHIFAYFHKRYPNVHLAMHAGELRGDGLQPPEDMQTPSEIREAIEIAGAERIGHGIDALYEADPVGLLAEMKLKHIMVEVCGGNWMLPTYIGAGVPVSLSTDDEGVGRITLTYRFTQAVLHYGIDYLELKKMVRTSLEHALIGGADLWAAPDDYTAMVPACSTEPVSATPSAACRSFLAASPRAKLEWNDEVAFAAFESHY
jgi:adenosine deaminase